MREIAPSNCNLVVERELLNTSIAKPQEVGMDDSRLSRLSAWQKKIVENQIVPNSMVLVARHGKVVYFDHVGEQNQGKNLSADTVFRIYSMTKPITSVAAMILVEEGKLLLSDPIWLYLGDKWRRHNLKVLNKRVDGEPKEEPCKTNITVLHLLTHCSGLGYESNLDEDADKSAPSPFAEADLASFVDKLSEFPLNYQPGSNWKYSYATDVLGRLVEVVSGKPFATFLQERIFDPLRMTHTSFHLSPAIRDQLSECWMDYPDGRRRAVGEKMLGRGQYRTGIDGFGGGGLLSTIGDYHRFTQMLMRGGELDGARVLSRRSVEYMTVNHIGNQKLVHDVAHIGDVGLGGHGFGLGFAVVADGPLVSTLQNPGAFGWGGMAKTNFVCDPREGLVIIFMTQVINLDDHKTEYVHKSLENQVYASLIDGKLRGCNSRL